MATTTTTLGFSDLPVEMQVKILENLAIHELVVNTSKTSLRWRAIIAKFILASKITKLANVNEDFEKEIKLQGWSQQTNDTELIMSLYQKYQYFESSKYHQSLLRIIKVMN